MEKGTLYEDDIYDIVGIPRPLHDFEHGAMTEKEMANLGKYRFPQDTQPAPAAKNDIFEISPKIEMTIPQKSTKPSNSSPGKDLPPAVIQHEYGYNSQGQYVGENGSRDKNGNLFEMA